MRYKPENDGLDHLNVYSKGKTELGRWLTNFAYSPIETEDGHFDSIEGYWYWISQKDDTLRKLSGWKAKEYGRSISGKDWIDDKEFYRKIKEAIRIKIESNPRMKALLSNSFIPFAHYYVYGNKIVDVPKAKWILNYLEELRFEIQGK